MANKLVKANMQQLIEKLDDIKIEIEGEVRRRTSNHLPVKLKPFKGREDERDFETFLKEYARAGDAFDWNEDQLLRNLPQALTGEGLASYDLLTDAEKDTWDDVKANLKEKFEDPEAESFARINCKQETKKMGKP